MADGRQVALDDGAPAGAIGESHLDHLIEAPRAGQRRIQDVGAVGGTHEQHVPVAARRLLAAKLIDLGDHSLHEGALIGAVHLIQQPGQGAGAATHHAAHPTHGAVGALDVTARLTDRVDLIDIGDAGTVATRVLARLAYEPDHLQNVHTHEHRPESGAFYGDERDPGLSGHRLGEHGLAGARRTVEQQAVDVAAAHLHELLAVGQQAQPLSHQRLQVGLPPIVVEGDRLGIRRPHLLHFRSGHEPEDGDELDDRVEDRKQELQQNLHDGQHRVLKRGIGKEEKDECRDGHDRVELAHRHEQLAAGALLRLDDIDTLLDQIRDAHTLPEPLAGLLLTGRLLRIVRLRVLRFLGFGPFLVTHLLCLPPR